MKKIMKKTVLFLVLIGLCCFLKIKASQPANSLNISSLSPSQQQALIASNGNPVAAAQSIQQNNINQANYFFSSLPQATNIPAAITEEINRVYVQGLGLPSTIVTHIQQFYSMLYLIAEEEALAQTVPANTLSTQVNVQVPANFSLTGAQLIQSKVWQDYLKIKIAYSYTQELQFLQQIQQNELSTFNYLPQFELNFYQDSFIQLRAVSQLTRFYLLMTEQLRQRYISQSTDWSTIVTSTDPAEALSQRNTLFQDIVNFQQTQFYTVTMQFEAVDPESTFPISSTGAPLVTAANFPNMFTEINGKLTVLPAYASFFEISSTTGTTPTLLMTGLGSIIYTGNIINQQGQAPYFETTDLFKTLFVSSTQNGVTTMTPTLGYMELLCFSALKALNAEVSYLFQSSNLAATLQKIQAIGQVQIPFFIFYQLSDYMFLNEINQLIAPTGPINNNTLAPGSVVSSSFFDSIGHFFTHTIPNAAKSAYNKVIKPLGNTVAHYAEAAAYGVEGEGLNLIVLPVCESVDAFSGTNLSSWASTTAKTAEANATQQLNNAMDDLQTTMAGITQTASSLAGALAEATAYGTGEILKQFNSKFASDYTNMFEKAAETVIGFSTTLMAYTGSIVGEYVVLTDSAVNALSATVGDIISGNTSSIGNTWKTFGESIASSVLSSITLVVSNASTDLSNAMQAVAYLISSIVDMIDDIGAAVAAAGAFMLTYIETGSISAAADSASSEFSSTYNAIDAHRSLISSIVTTALIVALTVATGGAGSAFGLAMLTVNVGMMAMNIAGTAQQEQLTVNQLSDEGDFVKRYGAYVQANEIQMSNVASLQAASYQAHTASALDNQNRTLAFYENWMNDITNSTISSQAYNLGSVYNYRTLFSTDSNNNQATPMIGDPGYLYGIQTGRICLNPGQGFLVYNNARQTFGQEIATPASFPQLTTLPVDNTGATTIKTEDNWFQIKDLCNIPATSPLVADIIFRSLYDSCQPFAIGVYLTERSLDIVEMNQLNKNFNMAISNSSGALNFDTAWAQLDTFNRYLLDYDSLAKMFVCYRNTGITTGSTPSTLTAPELGVYVHNSQSTNAQNGWLQTPTFNPINFKQGVWYRMQAHLKGTTLEVAFWEADNLTNVKPLQTPPSIAQKQTFTVDNAVRFPSILNPSVKSPFIGSMGVIACGAAVEYKVLAPTNIQLLSTQPVITSPTAFTSRSVSDSGLIQSLQSCFGGFSSASSYEQNWQKQLQSALNFSMVPYTLNVYNESLLLAGQNVYTITGTNSVAGTLIAGTSSPAGLMTDYVVLAQNVDTNPVLGVPKMSTQPNGFVSLVTGIRYYESAGSMIIKGVIPNVLNVYKAQPGTASLDSTLLSLIQKAQAQYTTDTTSQPIKFNNISLQADAESLASGLYIYKGTFSSGLQNGTTDYFMLTSQTATVPSENQVLSPDVPIFNFDGMVSLTTNDVFLLQNSSQFGTGNTTSPTSLASMSALSFNLTSPIRTYSLAGYINILPLAIQNFILTAQAAQSEKSAVASAQKLLSIVGTTMQSGSTLYNANSALLLGNNSVSTLSSNSSTVQNNFGVVTALNTLNSAINLLQGDINIVNGLCSQVSTAIGNANAATGTNVVAATNALTALVSKLTNANNALGNDTINVNNANNALKVAINAVPAPIPSPNGTRPADGSWIQGLDPANYCVDGDDCCQMGGSPSCDKSCGITKVDNEDVSCCVTGIGCSNSSDSCSVWGGPGNCWQISPNCVLNPVPGSGQYAPGPINDNCRIPQ